MELALAFLLFDAAGLAVLNSNHVQPLDPFTQAAVQNSAAMFEYCYLYEHWNWKQERAQLNFVFHQHKTFKYFPKLEELNRFPSKEQVKLNYEIAYEQLMYYNHNGGKKEDVNDQNYRLHILGQMYIAVFHVDIRDRRSALSKTRDLPGYKNFYSGNWPSPIR